MKPWSDGRPHRSLLSIPADQARMAEKIPLVNADVILLDLEDAVAPDQKEGAREKLLETLDKTDFQNKKVMVRINGFDTEWGESDLNAIKAHPKVDAIILPKVESRDALEKASKIAPEKPLWPLFETPKGIFNIRSILSNVGDLNIEALCFGNNDFAEQMGTRAKEPMTHARSEVVMAARANNLMVFDGPSRNLFKTSLADGDEIKKETDNARHLGFDGRMVIHPSQINIVNRAFSPTPAELRHAQATIGRFEERPDKGAVCVDGELAEELHKRQAQEILDTQQMIDSHERHSALAPR